MGDEPISLYSETFTLRSHNSDGTFTEVSQTFMDGATLPHVAELVRRLLLASGFSVTEVVIKSDINESSSEDAY